MTTTARPEPAQPAAASAELYTADIILTPAVNVADQVKRFTLAIHDPADIVEIRCCWRHRDDDDHKPRSKWCEARNIATLLQWMRQLNAEWNVYIGVNPRHATGAKSDASIKIARTIFCDIEKIDVAEALLRWESIGMPAPHVVVNSGHGVHIYSRLAAPITDLAAWRELQHDLAVAIGGDVKVRNPERIMRLPGFVNWKEPAALSELLEVRS